MLHMNSTAYLSAFGLAAVVLALISAGVWTVADTYKPRSRTRLALRVIATGFLANALLLCWVWAVRTP